MTYSRIPGWFVDVYSDQVLDGPFFYNQFASTTRLPICNSSILHAKIIVWLNKVNVTIN